MKSFLEKYPRHKNPYLVPESYFENFATRMMARIPVENSCTPMYLFRTRASRLQMYLYYSAAAVMVGLMFLGSDIYRQHHFVVDGNGESENYMTESYASSEVDFTYDYLMTESNNLYEYATNEE